MKNLLILFAIISTSCLFAQNNSLYFDGVNDYVSSNNICVELNNPTEFTMECWFKTEDVTKDQYFLSFNNNDKSNNLQLGVNSSEIKFYNASSSTFGSTLTNNTWYHVALTVDVSNNAKVYLNGNLEFTVASTSVRPNTNGYFSLAQEWDPAGASNFFIGSLDEIRVWNTVRTQTEIRQNMYQELPNPSGETNLVAYYKCNETSGTSLIDSKGSNTGTLINMDNSDRITSSVFFGPKNCLDFDGNSDYVDIPADASLNNDNFTIEFWAKLNAKQTWNTLLDKGLQHSPGDWYFVCAYNSYGIIFGYNTGNEFTFDLGNNNWHHIAVTCDGVDINKYLDGKLVNTSSSTYTKSANAIRMGRRVDPTGSLGNYDYNGALDEVRIWNIARTETQIREDMCKTLIGNETGLVAYYNFDNQTGTTLQDFSGNNNDGTVYAATWSSSSAFNTWLNTNSTAWTTASNWSRNSTPVSTDNVGIYNYSGGAPTLTGTQTVNNIFIGNSADLSLSSNITINGNIFLYDNIDLNNNTITLGSNAYLFEEEGVIYGDEGKIVTTRDLSDISEENIAGMGAIITTAENMGSTVIERHHHAISGDNNGINRYFIIDPTNNSGLDATLKFCYCHTELNENSENELSLFQSSDSGTSWANVGCTLDQDNNTLSKCSIDHFSWWTAAQKNTSLPVEIIDFSGNKAEHKNILNWNTASETNNKCFVLERSIDGKHFNEISRVNGNGNSNMQNSYEYTDINIENNKAYYYRLSNIDFDETLNLIKTIYINANNILNKFKCSIYPNPFKNYINIDINSNRNYTVTITNIYGINIYSESFSSSTKISTELFNKGYYIVKLETTNKTFRYKLLRE